MRKSEAFVTLFDGTAASPFGRTAAEVASGEIRLLGPVTASVAGSPLVLGSRKQRTVWAILALHVNGIVAVGTIANAVWNDNAPDTAMANIQVYVSGLRRSLGVVAPPGSVAIVSASGGYKLSVNADWIDVCRFRALATQGRRLAADGRAEAGADVLRRALGEWTGPALADLRGSRFADDVAAALEEDRLQVFEQRVDADLRCRRYGELIAELRTAAADNPLREPIWGQLITALYGCGRQGEALAAYRHLADTLQEELGLDPSPALRRLEGQVLRQEELNPPVARTADSDGKRTVQESFSWSQRAFLVAADGTAVIVGPAGLRIGRTLENDLVIDDDRVSRRHAAMTLTPEGFTIADLHSTNGTTVNGRRLSGDLLLNAGDEIIIGRRCLTFQYDSVTA